MFPSISETRSTGRSESRSRGVHGLDSTALISAITSTPRHPLHEHTSKAALDHTLAAKEDQITKLIDTSPTHDKTVGMIHLHIKDMTSLVRRLSRDIDRCEAALNSNTAAISSLSLRISNLENCNTTMETDSRINRCDTGIKELVRELRQYDKNISKIKLALETQTNVQTNTKLSVDQRFGEVERMIKKLDSEQQSQILSLKDQTKELGAVSLHLEKDMTSDIQQIKTQCLNKVRLMLEELDCKVDERFNKKDAEINRINETIEKHTGLTKMELEKLHSKQNELRAKIDTDIPQSSECQASLIKRLRGECMSGFKTLQDSVDTMHSILDSKIHLVEEDIRSEIKRAMRTVVVT